MIIEYQKMYEKELERAKRALFTAKSIREIRAIRNRIKFLQKKLKEEKKSLKKAK